MPLRLWRRRVQQDAAGWTGSQETKEVRLQANVSPERVSFGRRIGSRGRDGGNRTAHSNTPTTPFRLKPSQVTTHQSWNPSLHDLGTLDSTKSHYSLRGVGLACFSESQDYMIVTWILLGKRSILGVKDTRLPIYAPRMVLPFLFRPIFLIREST